MTASSAPPAPLGSAFLAGAGAALVAGLLLAVVDGVAAGGTAVITVLGLWALPTLGFALYAGAIAAGFRASFGAGAIGALRSNRDRDVTWAAFVVATLIAGIALAIIVPIAATTIVVKAHRPEAGAKVLGVVAMLAAVGAGLAIVPLAQLLRRGLAALPSVAGVPRVVACTVRGSTTPRCRWRR
jgi:hypothetical protein